MHGILGVAADHAAVIPGCLDRDARQACGGIDQRLERQVDPRRDDPALVGAFAVDHVERGRGAEIDHDQIAREPFVRGHGIHRTVRAQRSRIVDIDAQSVFDRLFTRYQRIAVEVFLRQHLDVVQRARHHGRHDHPVDHVRLIALQAKQLQQPDRVFVRGAARVGGDPPTPEDRAPVNQGKNDIGVADVYRQKHPFIRSCQGHRAPPHRYRPRGWHGRHRPPSAEALHRPDQARQRPR